MLLRYMQTCKYLRGMTQVTLVLQFSSSTSVPGQLFPFWHVRLLWRSPPWHVLLHGDQLPHEPQVAAAKKKTQLNGHCLWAKPHDSQCWIQEIRKIVIEKRALQINVASYLFCMYWDYSLCIGQELVLQEPNSVLCPTQLLPPSHDLNLFRRPPPQLCEHPLYIRAPGTPSWGS